MIALAQRCLNEVVARRAFALREAGKTIPEIAVELGIPRRKAERIVNGWTYYPILDIENAPDKFRCALCGRKITVSPCLACELEWSRNR